MRHVQSTFSFCLAAGLLLAPALPADVLVLKDGNKVEGIIADKGDTYEVKTKYGTLSINKSEVVKILKDPAQITAEAEQIHKLAKGMYDEALKIENDPKEKNRKLTAGVELLEKALKIYNEAREVFTGSDYDYLDKASTTIIQEMRLYRDKMSTEQAVKPAEPPPPPPPPKEEKPEEPASADAPKPEGPADFPLPEPIRPKSKKEDPKNAAAPPPPPPKTPAEYLADLGADDPKLRLTSAQALAKTPAPENLQPLLETLKKETADGVRDALVAALSAYDGPTLAKQAALKDIAQNSNPSQKRAVVSIFKKVGTEPGVKFLVDNFVGRGDVDVRSEVASALKKHKKIAIKPLLDVFRKSNSRPDLQMDIIKYVGITGESRQGAAFMIALMENKEILNTVLHALRKMDKPVVATLIEKGISGPSRTRMWSGWLLRGLTGQTISSSNAAEWSAWWNRNKGSIAAEEAKWDKADEACDWMVDDLDWSEYDTQVINSYYGTYWWWPWSYSSSRGRPRGVVVYGGNRFRGAGGNNGGNDGGDQQ